MSWKELVCIDFFGYDSLIWYLVVLNANGKLLLAIVIKYADTILKGFACLLAISITCFEVMFLSRFWGNARKE